MGHWQVHPRLGSLAPIPSDLTCLGFKAGDTSWHWVAAYYPVTLAASLSGTSWQLPLSGLQALGGLVKTPPENLVCPGNLSRQFGSFAHWPLIQRLRLKLRVLWLLVQCLEALSSMVTLLRVLK